MGRRWRDGEAASCASRMGEGGLRRGEELRVGADDAEGSAGRARRRSSLLLLRVSRTLHVVWAGLLLVAQAAPVLAGSKACRLAVAAALLLLLAAVLLLQRAAERVDAVERRTGHEEDGLGGAFYLFSKKSTYNFFLFFPI